MLNSAFDSIYLYPCHLSMTTFLLFYSVWSVIHILVTSRRIPLNSQMVVVITGCDSGFGQLASSRLAKEGIRVVAACLTSEGCKRVSEGSSTVKAVQCDVSKEEDVDRLVTETQKMLADDKELCLWAVVNNAGIAPLGYCDWLSLPTFRLAMEVNYFGLIAVTKAFLPLLKQTKYSRIINLSSIAGLNGGPMFGAYAASKHAVEGFTKCLCQELKPWYIHVANINPGFMRTPMVVDSAKGTLKNFHNSPKEIQQQYDDAIPMMHRMHRDVLTAGEDPSVVVNHIYRLVRSTNPALVNYAGVQAHVMRVLLALPVVVQDFLTARFVEVLKPSRSPP